LVVQPPPVRSFTRPRPVLYAGGESEAAKSLITTRCDSYVMHGDPPERLAPKIADLRARRDRAGRPPMQYGVAAYTIVRDTEREVQQELARITTVVPGSPGYGNFQDWLANTKLEQQLTVHDYSVSNRGLRTGLVGTPEQVAAQLHALAQVGVDLLLLQCSPQLEEMERFAAQVMPLVGRTYRIAA
jgi:FMNH2-dependent dimethyl sulfone monooxygenase